VAQRVSIDLGSLLASTLGASATVGGLRHAAERHIRYAAALMPSSLHQLYHEYRLPIAAVVVLVFGIVPSVVLDFPFEEVPTALGVAALAYLVGIGMMGFVLGIQLWNPMCSETAYHSACLFFFYAGLAMLGFVALGFLPNLSEAFPYATGDTQGPYRPSTYCSSLAVLPGVPAGALWMKSKRRAAA
jgi:hypothetical protein